MSRPRILFVTPHVDGAGGGTAVSAVILETLLTKYDVTLLTMRVPDLQDANRRFGTSLTREQITKIIPLRVAAFLIDHAPFARLAHLERALLQRRARSIAASFDLVVNGSNEIDVGRRAVQYIHFPAGYFPRPQSEMRWFHRVPGQLHVYYRLTSWILPATRASVGGNRTLVNSTWTGEYYDSVYHAPYSVLHPPVDCSPAPLPWEERSDTFLIAGRIAEEKRVIEAIAILEVVRSRGFDVGLTIVGTRDSIPYVDLVQAAASSRPWVRLRLDLARSAVLEEMGRVRYGIHGMLDEHFGMAVAELARSGAIVFVPDSGGPREIVREPALRYGSDADAVEKIVAVLADPAIQARYQANLLEDSKRFSAVEFRNEFLQVVDEELSRVK